MSYPPDVSNLGGDHNGNRFRCGPGRRVAAPMPNPRFLLLRLGRGAKAPLLHFYILYYSKKSSPQLRESQTIQRLGTDSLIKTRRLRDFIAQEERRGVGRADVA
jgi:hypothetical protein